MRNLRRNQIAIEYKRLISKKELKDEYGNPNGSYERVYSERKPLNISVSANKGDLSVQQFGDLLDYDRTLSTAEKCEIDENCLVYIDGQTYRVKAVAHSLNQTLIAIKRSEVNETN